ncbi:MAG TPA: hypothetical protein VFG54_19225 [Prolixibacteraceae bacterium]|nr:hypothetical protein [Prolixibacteraceae bacterium]
MDNQNTPCPEPTKGAESGNPTAGNHFLQASDCAIQSLNLTTARNDVFSLEELFFPEDECFVLAEEYVLLEEEYVMWNEDYSPRRNKRTASGNGHSFEDGELFFPQEEGSQYLEESLPA